MPTGGDISRKNDKNKYETQKGMIQAVYKYKAVLGSTTQALRAQRALATASIPSEVVKTGSGASHHGCVYGIEFEAIQYKNVRMILSSARINVRGYITDTDDGR